MYFSEVVLEDYIGTQASSHIAMAEYVLFALLCSPVEAHDGAVGVACMDPWVRDNGGGFFRPISMLH